MKLQDVKDAAKQRGIKAGSMKKAELIRTMQAAEGNEQCYETGQSDVCGQADCLWREDCK